MKNNKRGLQINGICTNTDDCNGCAACMNICHQNAIQMKSTKGFYYPEINISKCVKCNRCKTICPVDRGVNISSPDKRMAIKKAKAYALIHNDKKIQRLSSSGGAFDLLSRLVLDNDGIVYGAAFDEKYDVKHICITKYEDINLLYGSKYVQSNIDFTFRDIKKHLESGKSVLFCGTPCQVAGLKAFLVHDYSRLITIDFICHGIPSPTVWQKYIKEIIERYKQPIINVNFRDKRNGWKDFGTSIVFENQEEYYLEHYKDTYMKGFLLDLTLRKSCYSCRFKGKNRCSDITLADFWGVEINLKDLFNSNGVSLVITNTDIGHSLISRLSDGAFVIETDIDTALLYNKSYYHSVKPHFAREKFFQNLESADSVSTLIEKCLIPNYGRRIINKIKRIMTKRKSHEV